MGVRYRGDILSIVGHVQYRRVNFDSLFRGGGGG